MRQGPGEVLGAEGLCCLCGRAWTPMSATATVLTRAGVSAHVQCLCVSVIRVCGGCEA